MRVNVKFSRFERGRGATKIEQVRTRVGSLNFGHFVMT